ncbi:DNA gyrase, subunit C [Mycoplasma suis KI3806]|uniref:DNA gyrase, subunit C n=1 Tax=Mycoplasma suis (strain KI_3806) TaxID=708248 RepID=F0V2P8_MYCS3|nr:DNA gyrase C-terminal beta-propeller domain-containing protein [Mycoplasma suis]CBZ40120.1 DNA gyrase, subunit C [Mycoplasma suis KI3806]
MEGINMLLLAFSRRNFIVSLPYAEFNLGEKIEKGINLSGLISTDDMIRDVIALSSNDDLLIITNKGKIYRTQANQLLRVKKELSSENKLLQLQHVRELLDLDSSTFRDDEQIIKIINVEPSKYLDSSFLFLASKDGMIKKIKMMNFQNASKSGGIVMGLQGEDEVVSALIVRDADEILLTSSFGRVVRFKSIDLRDVGKTAMGVRGIKLVNSKGEKEGELISASSNADGKEVFVLTNLGKGKWVYIDHFRMTSRGVAGVLSQKGYGDEIFSFTININNPLEEIFMLTNLGKVSRIPVNAVSQRKGRATSGVSIMKLNHSRNEKIVHCFKFIGVKQ